MRKIYLLFICSVVVLSSCAKNNPAGNNAEPSSAEWTRESYLHGKYMDRSVKPGDKLYVAPSNRTQIW
ncbi:MAG: lipoprotein [Bacteroidales bacterium]|nr:lipoprotein [Bacteroidales bacterium]